MRETWVQRSVPPARPLGLGARRLLAVVLWAAALPAGAAGPFAWPDGTRAAVSLAYDDALPSQLDHALPALDRHGLKATFYLPLSSDTVRTRLADWRDVAAKGHELGNHTLFHQCSGAPENRAWVEAHRDLDAIAAAQMAEQVLLANTLLAAIDGRDARTLAVPCGDAIAGGEDYVARVRHAFVGIRHGEGSVAADMAAVDPDAVAVIVPVGTSGEELIALVDRAGRLGTMLALTFHGIGGDHLAVSADAHEALLDYLANHRDTYWVATFLDVMQHLRAQRAAGANGRGAPVPRVPPLH